FYLALYWAQELAAQSEDAELATAFGPIAKELTEGEETIAQELLAVQGEPADIGGYYRPDPEKASSVMRPSATFNRILEEISAARSEEHTSELQSRFDLVCRLLLEKKN